MAAKLKNTAARNQEGKRRLSVSISSLFGRRARATAPLIRLVLVCAVIPTPLGGGHSHAPCEERHSPPANLHGAVLAHQANSLAATGFQRLNFSERTMDDTVRATPGARPMR